MENQKYISIYSDEYPNLNTENISKIFLKNGTVLEINNNLIQNNYNDKSFHINKKSYYPMRNKENPKLKKFNSFSSNARYKINENDNDNNMGFYVTPIYNAPKRILKVRVPENNYIDLNKENYHIENFVFKSSPLKYTYKPYKKPKRNSNLKTQNSRKNINNCCCNCPGCKKNKMY